MVVQRIVNQWKDLRIQYTTEEQKLRIVGRDQVNQLRDQTQLSQQTPEGEQIMPGEVEKKAKLDISSDGNFAFLHLLPDDIQPSIVGDYDFIATVAVDQLNDPTVMQQNFFSALERIQTPEWSQLLFRQGKMVDALSLTEKVFDKLSVGIDGKDVLTDFPKGMNFNFDMPKVSIKYEDLPVSGKVAAAANAGIQVDPNDPQLKVMGNVQERVMIQGDDPQASQVLSTEGLLPQPTPPPEGPMGPQDMNSALSMAQDNHAAAQQTAQGLVGGVNNGQ